MFKHTVKKLPKSTVELQVTVPQETVKKEYEKAFAALSAELTVEGFRKGKAPRNVAEKHLRRDDIYNQLIRAFLPDVYEEIVKKENLKPVVAPRVELVKAKEDEDWEFKITLAEKPVIELGNYKKAVLDAKAAAKKTDIWVPGKDQEANKKNEDEQRQHTLNSVLGALMKEVKAEISDLIVEEEVNTRLSRLLDDIQRIGLTAEAYLKSKNTTMEQLQARVRQETEETYKLEFVLAEIAEKEKITVEDKDLEALFTHITDEKERKAAQQNAYFYASVLRKQKTLDYLTSL
jgi:FKBP-type peptidyl-prolyl cis-trans isomerase (trigger factor)